MAGELTERMVGIAARAAARQARTLGRVADGYGVPGPDGANIHSAMLRSLAEQLEQEADPLVRASLIQTAQSVIGDLMNQANAAPA